MVRSIAHVKHRVKCEVGAEGVEKDEWCPQIKGELSVREVRKWHMVSCDVRRDCERERPRIQ